MRTFTTLAAAAALIASVSIAGAQSDSQKAAPESLHKNKAQSTETGEAMKGSQKKDSGMKVTGKAKFCMEQGRGGTLKCTYKTMASCEKEAKANGFQCSSNPSVGTTGAK
jgi:hypothetical protein